MKNLLLGMFSCALVIVGTNGCESSSAQTSSDPFPDDVVQIDLLSLALHGVFDDGRLLCSAFTPDTGRELWVYDRATNSIEVLVELYPGPDSGYNGAVFFRRERRVEEGMYFRGRTSETGEELWFTDGTAEGTILVRDVSPGPTDSEIYGVLETADELIFEIEVQDEMGTELGSDLLFISK